MTFLAFFERLSHRNPSPHQHGHGYRAPKIQNDLRNKRLHKLSLLGFDLALDLGLRDVTPSVAERVDNLQVAIDPWLELLKLASKLTIIYMCTYAQGCEFKFSRDSGLLRKFGYCTQSFTRHAYRESGSRIGGAGLSPARYPATPPTIQVLKSNSSCQLILI